MQPQSKATNAFVKNRTEELGEDVWPHFVVPPFFDKLDLEDARKPRVISGGRGCGKTMLLRYLSHTSAFSPQRETIPSSTLSHIGLYWRADTQFAAAMTGRGVPDDIWHSAFQHLVAVILGTEVLRSLESIACSKAGVLEPVALGKLDFSRLQRYFAESVTGLESLRGALDADLISFQVWVNNVRSVQPPRFLPGTDFLKVLIRELKQQVPGLRDSIYFVYLDEYENLSEYQHRIINTYLKHSAAPLIFNIAMKRNAFVTQDTTGPEPLMNIADYREHNLEDYLRPDFEIFAAEILCLTLQQADARFTVAEPKLLHDPLSIERRRDPNYRAAVVGAASKLFPDLSQRQLAEVALNDSGIARLLKRNIERALRLKGSPLSPEAFLRPNLPEATITAPALLNRKGVEPAEVLRELDALDGGRQSKFLAPTDWIHNNFIGCLLLLYEPFSRSCPFYAGFRTFCRLSRGNIRHLLELCHRSISQNRGGTIEHPIDPFKQADAARHVSAAFLGEIKNCGRYGNQLHAFVLRLGSLLALAHSRPSQSEPEPSHFSIKQQLLALKASDVAFINEAVKWSILFEEEETKQKDKLAQSDFEYVLNPIYSPYFRITYRKRRRIELGAEEFVTLSRGNYDEVRALLRKYTEFWKVDLDDVNQSLFSHLRESQA